MYLRGRGTRLVVRIRKTSAAMQEVVADHKGASQAMKRSAHSVAEDLLAIHLGELRLRFDRQFRFCADRRWRADFHLPEHRILIEVQGGVSKYAKFHPEWQTMGHQSGEGYADDLEKQRAATMLGFRVLPFTTQEVNDGTAKEFIRQAICATSA